MTTLSSAAPEKRLLLDTHVFLWWQEASDRLAPHVADRIANASEVHVSVATAWELAIKVAAGKLRLGESFADAVEENRFGLLPITLDHVAVVASMPLHHRDPFDRMLIAQARHEQLTLVTHDREFGAYPVSIVFT